MDAVESMVYTGKRPWHGKGTYVGEKEVTAAEAITAAGMDWEIKLRPVYCKIHPDAPYSRIENRQAIVREDTGKVFNVLSEAWTPLQNREAFSFFDAVVQEKAAIYHTAGVLKEGRVVWILAKLPGHIRVEGTDDITEKYVLLVNGHDGSMAVRLRPTGVRVVCWNTMTWALESGEAGEARLFHSKNLGDKVAWAREQIGLTNKWYEQFDLAMNRAAKRQVIGSLPLGAFVSNCGIPRLTSVKVPGSDPERREMINNPDHEAVLKRFETDPTNNLPGIKGSYWAAYNAVTGWVDHERGVRTNEQRRWERANFGDGSQVKQQAWKVLEKVI